MKFLILTDNYPPEMNARARIVSELAREWSKTGHKISVITSFPNFPRGKIFPGYKNKIYQKEQTDEISILRVKTYMYPNKGIFNRILDFSSFMFSGFIAGLFHKDCNIIIASTPQFFCAIAGCLLSIVHRKPFVLLLSDLWPDSVVSVGAMKKSFFIKAAKLIEKWLYKKADLIFISSPGFNGHLERLNINKDKVYLSLAGYNQQLFYPKEKSTEIIKKYNLEKNFVIGYIGTMGMAHKISQLFDFADKLKEEEKIKILLVGDGIDRDNIEKKIKSNNISNMIIDGPFPSNIVPEYISILDISIVVLANIETNKTVIPSKMMETMAMGKPIILYAPTGAASKMLTKAKSGIFIEIGKINLLVKETIQLMNDDKRMLEYSNNAKLFVKNFTIERQAYIISQELAKLKNT